MLPCIRRRRSTGYHVIATDLGGEAEEVVWQYNSRAQMGELPQGAEERFGEGADALGVMGYNTSILQKLYLLPEGWHPKTISPLRWALIEMSGKLLSHGSSLILKLATAGERSQIYLKMRHCCFGFS